MSKFKVGDKVRLRDDPQARAPHPVTGRKLPASEVFKVINVTGRGEEVYLAGKAEWWGSERFKKVEEHEMVDVRVGDLVKLTRKGEPERTVTDYVIGVSEDGDFRPEPGSPGLQVEMHRTSGGYNPYRKWDVEVLKRPYKLPTVPGLYTAAATNDKILGGSLFELNEFGDWTANGNLRSQYSGEFVADFLKMKEWPLKRLVIEG